jgi:hypothetical protein
MSFPWKRAVPALALSVVAAAATASPAAAELRPEPRHVITLTNRRLVGAGTAGKDIVHAVIEMPLNHVGLVARRFALEDGPPPAEAFDDARAVLTYFDWEQSAPDWLWPWLEQEVLPRGLRVVHLGSVQPMLFAARGDIGRMERWTARFGLEWIDDGTDEPTRIDVDFGDPALTQWESRPWRGIRHMGPRNVADANRVWLSTRDRMAPGDVRAQVVTGPWGGLALDPWVMDRGSEDLDRRWYLDPFTFLREALGMQGVPVPDPVMLNGRRMLVLQVDGDGFESLSTVERGKLAAEVFEERVLKAHRLPFTVSVIVRSLIDDLEGEDTPAIEVARRIFALDNVEIASHTVLHPLLWQEPLLPDTPPQTVTWYDAIGGYEYDQAAEVTESVRFIDERLAPPGKRCEVLLWSGFADPPAKALRAASLLGIANLNGGVFRWDALTASAGFVWPLGREVEGSWQIYAGAANENDFEGFFDTMPGAFRHIDDTIENTGLREILTPADIYSHFYSAERPPRLAALDALIRRWAYEEETAPVFASTYARSALSALTQARVLRAGRGFALRDFGGCRSARIDDEPRFVDWAHSKGLLGARHKDGALHLHLAGPDADVVLRAEPLLHVHVEEANHVLADGALTPAGVRFVSEAVQDRHVTLAGFAPGGRATVALDGGEPLERAADEHGRLVLELPPGRTLVEVGAR